MNPTSSNHRILTFDLIRGYFLFMIVVDHVGRFPSVYDAFTGRGQMWVSAAEGFFFISGLLVSLTKTRRLAKEGWKKTALSIWKRAAVLYAWSVVLTLGFTALAYVAHQAPGLKGGAMLGTSTWNMIKEALLMRYTYGWADFLPHYAVFMFFAPFALYALSKGYGWLVAAVSLVVWMDRGGEFNRAWQIIFFGGMMAGYYLPQIQAALSSVRHQFKRATLTFTGTLTAITLYLSSTTVFGAWPHPHYALQPYFNRDSMEIGRIILFMMSFGILYWFVRKHEQTIVQNLGWILLPFGQHSLYVYILHSILVFGLDLALAKVYAWPVNFLLVTATLSTIWLSIRFKLLTEYVR